MALEKLPKEKTLEMRKRLIGYGFLIFFLFFFLREVGHANGPLLSR